MKHTHHAQEYRNFLSIQGLSEPVSNHLVDGKIFQVNFAICNRFANSVIFNINMLNAMMKFGIFSEGNHPLIICSKIFSLI